jgi:demethylmenaquinone methyltransferase/2-methoxy-6-polyprenyl-1,4-benzoquinol methylase
VDLFGLVAPFYDAVAGIAQPNIERLNALAKLEGADRFLDAGGGTGRVAQALQQLLPEGTPVWLVDLSSGMLQQAAEKSGIVPCRAAAEALPFPDGYFPAILAIDTFHHFHDHARAARELIRILAPGGRLVIEEPDVRRFVVKLVALGERLALMRSHFYPPDELMGFFDADDLMLDLHEEDHTYWLVVEKVDGAR